MGGEPGLLRGAGLGEVVEGEAEEEGQAAAAR